jgi:hypothetical protein
MKLKNLSIKRTIDFILKYPPEKLDGIHISSVKSLEK